MNTRNKKNGIAYKVERHRHGSNPSGADIRWSAEFEMLSALRTMI